MSHAETPRTNPWLLVATDGDAQERASAEQLVEALGAAGYPVVLATVPRGRFVEPNTWEQVAARIFRSEVALFALTPSAQSSAAFLGALYWAERCAEVERESDGGKLTRVLPVFLDVKARKDEWRHGTYPAVGLPDGWRNQGAMGLGPLIAQLPSAPVESARTEALKVAKAEPEPLGEDDSTSQEAAHYLGIALAMLSEGVLDEHVGSGEASPGVNGAAEPLVGSVEEAFDEARSLAHDAGDTALELRIRMETVDFEILTPPRELESSRLELHSIARDAAEAGLFRIEGDARFQLSEMALDEEDMESIEAQLRAMYALAQRHADTHMLARAQSGLGSYEALTGQGDAAVRYYRDAAKNFAACGDYDEQAAQLLTLGTLLNSFKRDEEAEEVYAEALQVYEALGDIGGVASLRNNFGQTYRWQERFAEAHESFREALRLFEQLGETDSVLRVRHNIARTHIDQEEHEEARVVLEENRDTFERLGDNVGLARTLRDLGLVLEELDEQEAALQHYERGLELLQQAKDEAEAKAERRPWVALSMGQIYAAQEEFDRAENAFEQAVQEAQDLGDAPVAADAAFHLALLAMREAEAERAWHWLQQALLVSMEVSPDELSFDVQKLFDLARELGAPSSLELEDDAEDEYDDGEDKA